MCSLCFPRVPCVFLKFSMFFVNFSCFCDSFGHELVANALAQGIGSVGLVLDDTVQVDWDI